MKKGARGPAQVLLDMCILEGDAATTHRDKIDTQEMIDSERKVGEDRTIPTIETQPVSSVVMAQLAATYWNQARWSEAEYLYLKILRASSETLGEEHVDTLQAAASLAATLCNQERWDEAAKLEKKVMAGRSLTFGEGHWSTLLAMANLASTRRRQGRRDDAEELWNKLHRFRSKTLNCRARLRATLSADAAELGDHSRNLDARDPCATSLRYTPCYRYTVNTPASPYDVKEIVSLTKHRQNWLFPTELGDK